MVYRLLSTEIVESRQLNAGLKGILIMPDHLCLYRAAICVHISASMAEKFVLSSPLLY